MLSTMHHYPLLLVCVVAWLSLPSRAELQQPLLIHVDDKQLVTREDIVNPLLLGDDDDDDVGEPLGLDDFALADQLQEIDLIELGVDVPRDPTLTAGKVEGDMAIAGNVAEFVASSSGGRNAVRSAWRKWPNGRVPYTLSKSYGWYSRRVIARAMSRFADETCVRFVPKTDADSDYVHIHPDVGCYSLVGRTGGRQPLSLDEACIATGTVMHELMHTTGFFHEQSRADRDDWIEIEWANVKADAMDQFEKYSLSYIDHLGEAYDYASIMHYSPYAFSANDRPTIRTLKPGGWRIGQRDGFSDTDIRKINSLYKCDAIDTDGSTSINDRSTPVCTDKAGSARCVVWKYLRYCTNNERVKTEYCRSTCNTCGDDDDDDATAPVATAEPSTTTSSTTTASPDQVIIETIVARVCRDKNTSCAKSSTMGFCRLSGYRTFMRNTCAHSCGHCERVTTTTTQGGGVETTTYDSVDTSKCADTSNMCALAEWSGLCAPGERTEFVTDNCRKTCALC